MVKRIVFTGGGSAGHVTPNLSIAEEMIQEGYDVHYLGTKNGIENTIVPKEKINYHAVRAGKLRRYFSFQNFIDPFNVIIGTIQSYFILKKLKPALIFSKGGFVSVPVIIGGWLNKIPTIIHESDISPGLANRISIPFCKEICTSFEETLNHLPQKKSIFTGTPIRKKILEGSVNEGLRISGFNQKKPIILILGGSLGSEKLNKLIWDNLHTLLEDFQIIHLCGKGKLNTSLENLEGYIQYEYVDHELPHLLKITDLAISRAGANSIFEFISLKIPSLLIPLSKNVSRGDQILNAKYSTERGYSRMILEEELNEHLFLKNIYSMYEERQKFIDTFEQANIPNGKKEILSVIRKHLEE